MSTRPGRWRTRSAVRSSGRQPARGRDRREREVAAHPRRGAGPPRTAARSLTRISDALRPLPMAAASTRTAPGSVGLEVTPSATGVRTPPATTLSRAASSRPSTPSSVTSPPGRPSSPRSGCSVPPSIPVTTSVTVLGGARCRPIRPPGRVSDVNAAPSTRSGRRLAQDSGERAVGLRQPDAPEGRRQQPQAGHLVERPHVRSTIRLLASRPSRARRRRRFASSTSPA